MLLLSALLACGDACDVGAPLDYDDDAHWLCTPESPGACPDTLPSYTVSPGGAVVDAPLQAASDPGVACFAVYPTFDLRVRANLDAELAVQEQAEAWARFQAGPLRQVCDLYVPLYRQVTVGTFLGRATGKKDACMDAAYSDVAAAFEAFLEREPDRPFVLFGHSQGGMHVTRLLQERVENDPELLTRLVAAYPVGWAVGTASGSDTGGSFATLPTCSSATQTGCVMSWRSYLEGEKRPTVGRFLDGDTGVCTHPGSPDAPGARRPLRSFWIHTDHLLVHRPDGVPDNVLLRYDDGFEAGCTGAGRERALEASWIRSDAPPLDLGHWSVAGANGSHILDLNLGLADVVEDVARRAGGAR